MGRELRRKEERKNKNKVVNKEKELDTSVKMSSIIKVIAAIVFILLVLWYVLAIFVTKEVEISSGNDENNTATETSGVSNRILASSTFNQAEEVYHVYYYDFANEDKAVASAISSQSDIKIYRVDTSSSLNEKYVTEEAGNARVTGIDNLKVKNPTLLQITNDSVTGYYEGSSNIIAFLNK